MLKPYLSFIIYEYPVIICPIETECSGQLIAWNVKLSLHFPPSVHILLLSAYEESLWPLMLTYFPLFSSQESKSSGRSSMPRCRNSVATTTSDEQPHIGNYRLLKTIGKGNFAKVKLARHVLTGKEVGMHAQTH